MWEKFLLQNQNRKNLYIFTLVSISPNPNFLVYFNNKNVFPVLLYVNLSNLFRFLLFLFDLRYSPAAIIS